MYQAEKSVVLLIILTKIWSKLHTETRNLGQNNQERDRLFHLIHYFIFQCHYFHLFSLLRDHDDNDKHDKGLCTCVKLLWCPYLTFVLRWKTNVGFPCRGQHFDQIWLGYYGTSQRNMYTPNIYTPFRNCNFAANFANLNSSFDAVPGAMQAVTLNKKNIHMKGCSKYTFKFKIGTLLDFFFPHGKINALNSIFHATSYVLVLYNLDFVSPNVFGPTTGNLVSSSVTA